MLGIILFNLVLVLLAYVYVLIVVGIGIIFEKKTSMTSEFTRKTIHVLAGFVIFVVFFLTPSLAWLADIIAVSFVILLWLAGPTGPKAMQAIFSSMARVDDEESGKIYGPFYYAISITVLTVIFTFPPGLLVPLYWIPASALSMMYLGDGIAPFIGKKFGRYKYGPNERTIVGSATVFGLAIVGGLITMSIAYGITILGLGSQNINPTIMSFAAILITAACFAVAESQTPHGYDNITCPLISTIVLVVLALVFGLITL